MISFSVPTVPNDVGDHALHPSPPNVLHSVRIFFAEASESPVKDLLLFGPIVSYPFDFEMYVFSMFQTKPSYFAFFYVRDDHIY